MNNYKIFNTPEEISEVAPFLQMHVECFTSVVGHTDFGDLFLRCPATGEYAILVAENLSLESTGYLTMNEFITELLGHEMVRADLIRGKDLEYIERRIGPLGNGQVYFPVPVPALGGNGNLNSYDRGDLWTYLSIMAQTQCIQET
jgi:hypothetical protein